MNGNTAIPLQPERPVVRCACNSVIFDGLVIKSRVVRVLRHGSEAKCKHCREWVKLPLSYNPNL